MTILKQMERKRNKASKMLGTIAIRIKTTMGKRSNRER